MGDDQRRPLAIQPARYYRAKLAYDLQSFKSVKPPASAAAAAGWIDLSVKEEYKRKQRRGAGPGNHPRRSARRQHLVWQRGRCGLALDPFIRQPRRRPLSVHAAVAAAVHGIERTQVRAAQQPELSRD
jgi:hypothetical protein